ncbi:MAG: 3-hydroxyacyl-CoA dehydrogenase NAD-binding domain-containing protein [Betaproteobacteria bacterium]|jgi:3-hydroxybutyryl-CoA dehydrogenase|nr:3-hydroxyacyl-CoA dehydrogenase NAD-binding domain-containing protein [Betaproteobacteria bacterium]MDH4292590.1 3-hydroxyacyl-CoA dehydrogenase NAD-binding domain-containing protein [Betaproteobacteria bacterium]MDH5341408.1 3-hydroxyacyl-CoA dehydrogenase NAD-binding domain-containing protein [Betaproteobacteria bacterium]
MPELNQHAVIIGGGIMGGDIATLFAARGWTVHVMSPSAKTRDALPARIATGLAKLGAPASHAAAVHGYAELKAVPWADVDIVVEAALEDLALKQKLFAQVESFARPEIPLVSNTSNFPIGDIAKGLKHPARVAGLHFFMPAHLVPLVEVVSSPVTAPKIAEDLVQLLKDLQKAPIWVKKDVPGFVGNRLQHAMMREALYLIADGVTDAEGIDTAVRYGFGFRFIACGPMMQKEMSGWDTHDLVASALYPHLHAEKKPPQWLKDLVAKGRTGMKAKAGMWDWDEGKVKKEKARIERALQAAFKILQADDE